VQEIHTVRNNEQRTMRRMLAAKICFQLQYSVKILSAPFPSPPIPKLAFTFFFFFFYFTGTCMENPHNFHCVQSALSHLDSKSDPCVL